MHKRARFGGLDDNGGNVWTCIPRALGLYSGHPFSSGISRPASTVTNRRPICNQKLLKSQKPARLESPDQNAQRLRRSRDDFTTQNLPRGTCFLYPEGVGSQSPGSRSAPWVTPPPFAALPRRGSITRTRPLIQPFQGRTYPVAAIPQGALARPWAPRSNPFGVNTVGCRRRPGCASATLGCGIQPLPGKEYRSIEPALPTIRANPTDVCTGILYAVLRNARTPGSCWPLGRLARNLAANITPYA
jgi:hypothetical protein